MTCPACGTSLPPTARYCHKCGARQDAGPAAAWQIGVPWALAGAALGALIAVLALRVGGGEAGAPRTANGARLAVPAPDISQMSPEERATRLFDRVMRLAEANQLDSVQFFLPMALRAHALLPALDPDARLHIGLLSLTGGDHVAALGQADTILRATPTHLFGFLLRARARTVTGDSADARRAYLDFLRYESAERARARPEYGDHQTTLDTFHDEATARTTRR